jgi:hypothetical protein
MDFTKIPKDKRERVRKLIRENNIVELQKIHTQYKLSEYDYSCCNLEAMMRWYQWGVDKKLI